MNFSYFFLSVFFVYVSIKNLLEIMLSKENAHKSIEIMFGHAIKRIEELNEPYRQCLFEEYKEWIEGLGDEGIGQDAIVFKYIGNLGMH